MNYASRVTCCLLARGTDWLAEDGFEFFGRYPARVTQVDLVVFAGQRVAVFKGEGVHAGDGGAFVVV